MRVPTGDRVVRQTATVRGSDPVSVFARNARLVAGREYRVRVRSRAFAISTLVLAIVAAACHAEGVMRITNVGNLRLKECDRIDEPAEELRRLGVAVRTGPDWIEVEGRADGYEGGVTVDSHGDHRVAQMLAIVGLRCLRPVTITRAEHISKSYPGFFEDLARLGAHVERVDDRV